MVQVEEKRIRAWHFLPNNGFVKRLNTKAEKGLIITHEGPINICKTGLHASIRAIDALAYAPGHMASIVEIWGDVQSQDDKICGRNREIIELFEARDVLNRFACNEAKMALDLRKESGFNVDPRSYEAIRVKLLWLDGKASDQELAEARQAAAAAADAYAAANAAYAAAYAAAAAADAADADAAAAAAYAAADAAAYAAYKQKQNERLEEALLKCIKP